MIADLLSRTLFMDFFYDKFPKIPVGIIKKIDGETLFYEPYRSFAHRQIELDLEAGIICKCNLEDGRKIEVVGLLGEYGKLKIKK